MSLFKYFSRQTSRVTDATDGRQSPTNNSNSSDADEFDLESDSDTETDEPDENEVRSNRKKLTPKNP